MSSDNQGGATTAASSEGCWRIDSETGEVYYDPACDPNNPDPITTEP